MRILITRPTDDAAPLAEALAAQGHETLVEPMLHITYREGRLPDLTGVQALLFTSANGVRAAARATESRTTPVLCVGDATARAARQAGFTSVSSASGDVDSLAELAMVQCRPGGGPLLHVAGSAIAGDLAGTLKAKGFTVERAVLYEAHAARALSKRAQQAIHANEIDAVLLFSPRSGATFAKVVRDAGLEAVCEGIDILCLSNAVAEALDGLPHRALRVAEEPTQEALLRLIS